MRYKYQEQNSYMTTSLRLPYRRMCAGAHISVYAFVARVPGCCSRPPPLPGLSATTVTRIELVGATISRDVYDCLCFCGQLADARFAPEQNLPPKTRGRRRRVSMQRSASAPERRLYHRDKVGFSLLSSESNVIATCTSCGFCSVACLELRRPPVGTTPQTRGVTKEPREQEPKQDATQALHHNGGGRFGRVWMPWQKGGGGGGVRPCSIYRYV